MKRTMPIRAANRKRLWISTALALLLLAAVGISLYLVHTGPRTLLRKNLDAVTRIVFTAPDEGADEFYALYFAEDFDPFRTEQLPILEENMSREAAPYCTETGIKSLIDTCYREGSAGILCAATDWTTKVDRIRMEDDAENTCRFTVDLRLNRPGEEPECHSFTGRVQGAADGSGKISFFELTGDSEHRLAGLTDRAWVEAGYLSPSALDRNS